MLCRLLVKKAEININKVDATHIRVSIDETHTPADISNLLKVVTGTTINYQPSTVTINWPSSPYSQESFLNAPGV